MSTVVSASHVFFWHGPFSQWAATPFRGRLYADGPELLFSHAEQYMMAAKAHLFGDRETYQLIMRARTPKEQKALGRRVRGFDPAVWEQHREAIVLRASLYKFGQNPASLAELLATGDRVLVEASPYDRIWGIGMGPDDQRIHDPKNWRGLNLLGVALVRARDILRRDPGIDPFTLAA